MNGEELEIIIKPGGKIVIEGKGFVGADCKDFSAAYTAALGTVEDVVEKPEYHMKAEERQTQSIGRR